MGNDQEGAPIGPGEQLWIVRIVPEENGAVEKWIVSPIIGPQVPQGPTFAAQVESALRSVTSVDDDSETWDCREVDAEGRIEWVCTLVKGGRITGPGGRVFADSASDVAGRE